MDYRYERPDWNGRVPGDGAELEERPTRDLVKELFGEARVLVKEEIRLAKAEVRIEAKKAATAGAALGAGGVLLHLALFPFVAALVVIFDAFLPLWLAALVVAALVGIAGAVSAAYGKKRLQTLEPKRTVRSLKEDQAWAKDTMRSIQSHRHGNA